MDLSPEIIVLYVKKNCRQCHGKGYHVTDFPNYNYQKLAKYCSCVEKNLKKVKND